MSTSFAPLTTSTDAPALDPTKHVLYQLGMVLGVDDLSQDFSWLSTRGQVAVRELGGYGTVTGLRVASEVDTRGPRILVEPGTAYNPAGQLIRVCKSQCAYLDDWLIQNKDDVAAKRNRDANNATLYVTLCYRDCATDNVPIPGAPCRTEEQAMQPSRLADDFTLSFSWQAPNQAEADAIGGFVHWLRRIKSATVGSILTLQEFEAELLADEEAILAARCGDDFPSSPPDSPPSSPPHFVMSELPIPVPSGQECEYLRAAFRIWTTRFRPRIHPDLMAGACGCGGTAATATPTPEGCLLLAEIIVPLAPFGTLFTVDRTHPLEIHQKCRPTLVDIQMLQEYLFCALHNQELLAGNVTPAKSFGLPAANGVLDFYARADHSHGTPPLPQLDGEVTGDVGKTIVSKILTQPVGPGTPTVGQVLTSTGSAWIPKDLPTPPTLLPGPVVATTAFGLLKSDGALDEYARADHSHGTPSLPVPVVAAGVFNEIGAPVGKVFGKLAAKRVPPVITSPLSPTVFVEYQLIFSGFNRAGTYLVKGTVITQLNAPPHTIERIAETVQEPFEGIRIRITHAANEELQPGFSVEISEIL